jgi:cyanate lyase
VLELVLEDAAHGPPEGVILEALPDAQVLADTVDLDRLQDHVDRARAEEAADRLDHAQLEAAAEIQGRELLEREEALPVGDVLRLDDDQLVQDVPQRPLRHVPESAVEGEVEDLVEHELAAEV